MANRRELKRAIHCVAASLFSECVIFKELIPGVDAEKADQLLDKILTFQAEYLERVSNYGGRENHTLVKQYFKKLNAGIIEEAQVIFSEINSLNK